MRGSEQGRSDLPPPFFSVVIPVFNRGQSIGPAIDSVLGQTCVDFEVIVIDDGSIDSTPERLAAYGNRITVYRQANAGGGPARQLGILKALGTYVAFLDSDDVWPRWTLDTYRTVIEKTGSPSMLLGTAYHGDEQATTLGLDPAPVRFTKHADFLGFANEYRWFGFSVIAARRDCIPVDDALPRSRMAAQDLHFMLMMGTSPGFVVVESPEIAVYTRHAGNLSGNVAGLADAMRILISNERAGMFPGGAQRKVERQVILTRSARAASILNARSGERRTAWDLYSRCFRWHLAQRRWRYVLGFPFIISGYAIKSLGVSLGQSLR